MAVRELVLGPTQLKNLIIQVQATGKQFHRLKIIFDYNCVEGELTSGSIEAFAIDENLDEIMDGAVRLRIPGCPYPPDCRMVFLPWNDEKRAALENCKRKLQQLSEDVNIQ